MLNDKFELAVSFKDILHFNSVSADENQNVAAQGAQLGAL